MNPQPTRPDPGISERNPNRRSFWSHGDVVLEASGFVLVVLAIALVWIPLAIGVAGAGLILVANRPERAEGSADARPPTLP